MRYDDSVGTRGGDVITPRLTFGVLHYEVDLVLTVWGDSWGKNLRVEEVSQSASYRASQHYLMRQRKKGSIDQPLTISIIIAL